MKQQFKSGAVAAAPTSASAPSVGNPTEGDVANNMPATTIGANWFHQVGMEIIAVIEDAGLVPDADTLTQLRDALREKYLAKADAVSGGVTGVVDGKIADYDATASDNGKTIEVDASAGAVTVALPDLGAEDDGYALTVIKVDNSANAVTVDGDSNDTINAAATYVLEGQHEAATVKWTGSAWLAIGGASSGWVRSKFLEKGKGGGVSGAAASKNADYDVTASDDGNIIEVDAAAAARGVNLPGLAAANNGFTVTIIKTDSSANAVTLNPNGTDTINGAADLDLASQYETAILKWTGSAWLAIGGASTPWVRDFFGDASYREWTVAGVHDYTWEWDTPNALAILISGQGGGGGGGGGGGDGGAGPDFAADSGGGGGGGGGDGGAALAGGQEGRDGLGDGDGGDGGTLVGAALGNYIAGADKLNGGDGGGGGGGGGGGTGCALRKGADVLSLGDTPYGHGGDGGDDGGKGGRPALDRDYAHVTANSLGPSGGGGGGGGRGGGDGGDAASGDGGGDGSDSGNESVGGGGGGEKAGDGAASALTVGQAVHTTTAGPGGAGGGGGGAASRSATAAAEDGDDGNKGGGGAGGDGGGNRAGDGGDGGAGRRAPVKIVTLANLATGDAMTVTVGEGGAGGHGGGGGGGTAAGNGTDGGNGAAGAAGRVILIPLF